MLERAGCDKHRDADDIHHEQRGTLQVHDEDPACQRTDGEEQGAEKEDLHDHDRQERLQVPRQVIRANAGMIRPWGERPEPCTEHHACEYTDAGDKRARPAPAQVGKFRDRLGEQDLIGVTLEITQHGRAENRGNHDDPERRCIGGIDGIRVGTVQQHLAVLEANDAKALGGHGQE